MEYQSSTTLGAESAWDSSDLHETSAPSAGSSLPNWRSGFESRPWLFLGLAFGAGCAAAALIPSSDSDYEDYSSTSTTYSDSGSSTYSRSKSSYLSQTWGKMQSAFVVAATRQAEQFLEELVPGFQEAYREQGTSADKNPNTSEMP